VRTIQILTNRGERVAKIMAMMEAGTRDIYVHLILAVPWSKDMFRYSYRTAGLTSSPFLEA
jgi:hypothetical protein